MGWLADRRRARYAILVLVPLALSVVVSISVSAQQGPPGNNGTVKVDGGTFPDDFLPNNQPHVGCTFNIEFFNYDPNTTAQVTFELQPPTTSTTPGAGFFQVAGGVPLDGSGNGQVNVTLPASFFAGATPHPLQGFHVKLTTNAPFSNGADVKHKVFWMECAAAPPTTTTGGPTTGGPTTGGPTTGGPTTGGPTTGGPTTGGPTTGGPTTGGPTTGGPTTGGPTTGGPTTGGPTTGGPTTGGPTTGAPPAVVPPPAPPQGGAVQPPTQVLGQQAEAAPAAPPREQPTRVLAERLAVTGPVNLWIVWAAGAAFLGVGIAMIRAAPRARRWS